MFDELLKDIDTFKSCVTLIILFLLITFLITSKCSFDNKLEKNFLNYSAKYDDFDEFEFVMSEITYFKWTKLYIFKPGTSFKAIDEKLGKVNKKILNSKIDISERICLLVFVQDYDITKVIEVDRTVIDFAEVTKTMFTKENAKFKVLGGFQNRHFEALNYKY